MSRNVIPPAAPARVYVVDEDPLVTHQLRALLEAETEYEVQVFTAAGEALAAAGQRGPDAVITALRLGQGDGLALLAEIARLGPGGGDDLVGLVMTSRSDAAAAEALARVGPLRHVSKPCQAGELLPRLEAGLERRRLALALRASQAALASCERELALSRSQVERTSAVLRTTHSELETATQRLVQAEQLAAVGRVVTGIAHEISSQLALVGYAEVIKSRVADDPEVCECADIIVNAQKRLAAMVDQIRDFVTAGEPGGGHALRREPAELSAVVEEALALLRYDRDVRRRTVARSYRARPLVALDRQRFAQVIINLVSNAALATGPGDVISVAVEEDAARGCAIVAVVDQGTGMPPEVLARLGEPFFSTRGDRGSGLGVGICMRIVEEHGGRLTFASELGAGTTARLSLPLIGAEEVA
jgi:signal transduction histidine kinase